MKKSIKSILTDSPKYLHILILCSKSTIKYILLLITLSLVQATKSLESVPSSTRAASPATIRTTNPVAIVSAAAITTGGGDSGAAGARAGANTGKFKKPRSLNRVVAFELPTLQFKRDKPSVTKPDHATVVEWDSSAPTGRPRRASSFSDLRELAESTQARPAPGVNRSVRVMLVPEPIDLCGPRAHSPLFREDSCIIEMGDTSPAGPKDSRLTRTASKLTRTGATDLSGALESVGAPESTVPVGGNGAFTRTSASASGHDPLVLALAASLKTYTEQNSEFLRNQAEQNRVSAEERNTTRRGVRDAKIIGAVATVGTLVGPYAAPYITAWVKSWI